MVGASSPAYNPACNISDCDVKYNKVNEEQLYWSQWVHKVSPRSASGPRNPASGWPEAGWPPIFLFAGVLGFPGAISPTPSISLATYTMLVSMVCEHPLHTPQFCNSPLIKEASK